MNPYALSLAIENFSIQERDGTTQFLGWRRLRVNFNALSSLRGEWVFGEITLDGFNVPRTDEPGSIASNISDLLEKFTPPRECRPRPTGRPSPRARFA